MARSIDKAFYSSPAWKRCREAYIKKCGGLCELCFKKGIYKAGYIVHHKIHLTEENYRDPSVALNFDNLLYVCQDCHNKIHFANARRYKIMPNGEVIIK
jgi:5-methylcytosine-specific restriction endonuclease McrA